MKTMLTKMYVKGDIALKSLRTRVFEALRNEQGFATIEWVLLIIVVAGVVIIMKPLISATFSKIAGLFDNEAVNKFNGAK